MSITEVVEGHGEGSIRLVDAPAEVRRMVSAGYGFMSAILVTPTRLPRSVNASLSTLVTAMNSGGGGGWIVRTEGRGGELNVALSGWAELLTSVNLQTDWGFPLGFTNTAKTLAAWQDDLTIGGLLARNGTAVAGAGAPADFAADPDLAATRIEKIGVVADIFRCNWRVRLDSADGYPVLDLHSLDNFGGGSTPALLVSPDVPSGQYGTVRVLGGAASTVDDGADFVTRSVARSGGGTTLADYLKARSIGVATAASNVPFRHPFGAQLGRERRVDTTIAPADPGSPPSADTTTVASLTAIATAEVSRFGKMRIGTSVEVTSNDVTQIPLAARIWVQDQAAGVVNTSNPQVVGAWPIMPVEMRVVGRTIPITPEAGVYLWSLNTNSMNQLVDLTDWVEPDDSASIDVAPIHGRSGIRADVVGRQRR